ncbi:N-acetyltransferase [Parabacteroides sp. OttesenSCG-928-G07]|nr:N-acetyltransferase [Parabacteroides sp. OttesenSCG-928-G21]MDL2277734.1 N-acetyltransferase [Parabacteroides sp. OttesenSCG-928-G07]
MNEQLKLIDNKEAGRYEFHIEGYIPLIDYRISDDGDIYLIHTEVPLALEGRGIGSQLVKEVLTDVKSRGLRLIPLCPFVAGYIKKHPEWRKIVS